MANIRTFSQLPPANSVNSDMLFAVSENVANQGGANKVYASKSLSAGMLQESTNNYVMAQLEGNPHYLRDSTNFTTLEYAVSALVLGQDNSGIIPPYNDPYQGKHEFQNLPLFDQTLSSFEEKYDKYAVNVATLKNFEDSSNALMINSGASYRTKYFNVQNNEYEILSGIENAVSIDKEAYHNVYIFRIQGYESNEWACPANGMFTCYGWVSEMSDVETNNSKRWVALEGKFYDENDEPIWKILSLQPVISNVFCSYVSFNFPVNEGMVLRLRSGFNVGTNSNKYQAVNGSLTNGIANAFVGGIYSKHSWGYSVPSGGGSGVDRYIQNVATSFSGNKLKINLTRNEGTGHEPSVLTSDAVIPIPTKLSMEFVNDTLALSLTLANGTIKQTSIQKQTFVNWLSADIMNAIIGALPQTIVTAISSVNLGVTSDPALSANATYATMSYTPAQNKYISDFDTTTTEGNTVAGTSCGSGWTGSAKAPSLPSSNQNEDLEEETRYNKLIEEVKKEIED